MQAMQRSNTDPQPFQLSLRVRHPSMDPAEISRALHIKPEHCFRAGDPRPSRGGIAAVSMHAESYWLGALTPGQWPPMLAFPGRPELGVALERLAQEANNSIGWALSLCATRFLRQHAEPLRHIRTGGGEICLLVALSTSEVSGFTLVPEVSRALSDFGITVEFDFSQD